ncbi:bifunctional diguanylate cyclase/phosphodiesterase [Paraglaciecola aquimarina]|uniref:Bifunctional diguanylate cyclase/phosphodiesterase n=1 Tax=Paraglaciecola algarum TaxID=3050085 RepID=A0ABS9D2Y0_9ALTE|nr:bifunctional diguanylate cyclase/phosphodiesterase [Paraglaciecola sp. G1-23]MCF2947095.1 bifunctional diguanylate cyclase/phosphodiesterase [Paraglaciecola sp. G1-23]
MTPKLRNTIIFISLFVSIFLVAAYKIGLFNIQLDLLSPKNHTSVYGNASANINQTLTTNNNTHVLKCKVLYNELDNYCAFTILLSNTGDFLDLMHGRDLSKYQFLDMDLDYTAPLGNPNLRVSIRNYKSSYTKKGDYGSLKYNSIAFEPQFDKTTSAMPLSSFSVEDWWIERYNIPSEQSHTEYTNVPFIEILPNEISKISDYEISVNRFILRGEIITEPTLLSFILGFWLILIMVLMQNNAQHLKLMATTDGLTGCSNRRGLMKWVDKNLNRYYKQESITVFYLDLDDFKKINDKYGHNAGDSLLQEFTRRIQKTSKQYFAHNTQNRVFRLAGDEFAIVVFNLKSSQIEIFAKALITNVNLPMNLKTCTLKVSLSMGIVHAIKLTDDIEALIDKADMAMYVAKKQGKNQFKVFDEEIEKNKYFRKNTAEKLRNAISLQSFHLNFMPIYDCKTLSITQVEVLLRCDATNLEGVGPDVFIPIAEEFNIIHDIDMWVIETTLKILQQNKDTLPFAGLVYCINISAVELNHSEFVSKLQSLLNKYKVKPTQIELEITETSLVDINKTAITRLQEIKALGVKLSLDDFGTGYTAFNQLMHYPVNSLKIDKSFIDDLHATNIAKVTMVNTMLSIAQSFDLKTVAEGIETQEQLSFLQGTHCNMVQGYFLSKPLKLDKFLDLVST